MPNLEERECEACGIAYTPNTTNQKYCPDCMAHGGIRMRRKYDQYTARSRQYERETTPKIYDNTCEVCGKEFKSIYIKNVCSDACSLIKRKREMTCAHCGCLLSKTYAKDNKEIPDEELTKRLHFCSKECEQAYFEEKYPARTCANCGEIFHNANIKFCCRDCQINYQKKHKKPVTKKPPEKRTYTYICFVCGRKHTKPHCFRHDYTKKGTYKNAAICSETCLDTYDKNMAAHQEEDRKKRLANHIKANGMCGICDVSYKDCERMQSDFRIKPKGARYIDGKIQVCPKFKTKFK